jgi:hypothetical protein
VRPPFVLVPTREVSDTAKCVEALAAGIRDKSVIGLAYVVIYRERNYEAHICGEAARSPTFTGGAVGALQRKLGRLIDGEPAGMR